VLHVTWNVTETNTDDHPPYLLGSRSAWVRVLHRRLSSSSRVVIEPIERLRVRSRHARKVDLGRVEESYVR